MSKSKRSSTSINQLNLFGEIAPAVQASPPLREPILVGTPQAERPKIKKKEEVNAFAGKTISALDLIEALRKVNNERR